MAPMLVNDTKKVGAEVHYGHEACVAKALSLLKDIGLPDGLLPLEEIEELGFVQETGYFWIKQKQKIEHMFDDIKTKVSYGQEVSGYLEKKKAKKLQGVKAKEFLLWVPISEISDQETHPGLTYFKSLAGIGKYHPTKAFNLQQNIQIVM